VSDPEYSHFYFKDDHSRLVRVSVELKTTKIRLYVFDSENECWTSLGPAPKPRADHPVCKPKK